MKIVNTQRAISPKIGKPELWFMCSARRLIVFNVCVKFHENVSSGFKVMEKTRKLLTDTHTHTQRKDKNYIPPWHTSYAGDINRAPWHTAFHSPPPRTLSTCPNITGILLERKIESQPSIPAHPQG